jgi:hypothetical protein
VWPIFVRQTIPFLVFLGFNEAEFYYLLISSSLETAGFGRYPCLEED